MYALSTICLHMNRKAYVASNFSALSKLKDFWRSQPVTFTVNVVVSQKLCHSETLSLQTTIVMHGLSNRGNSNDLECPSRFFAYYKVWFFRTIAQQLKSFQLTSRVASSLQQLSFLLIWHLWHVRKTDLCTASCCTRSFYPLKWWRRGVVVGRWSR